MAQRIRCGHGYSIFDREVVMTTTTDTTCDRCQAEHITSAIRISYYLGSARLTEFDLCDECFKKLIGWIKLGVNEDALPDTIPLNMQSLVEENGRMSLELQKLRGKVLDMKAWLEEVPLGRRAT